MLSVIEHKSIAISRVSWLDFILYNNEQKLMASFCTWIRLKSKRTRVFGEWWSERKHLQLMNLSVISFIKAHRVLQYTARRQV